jgi:transposase
MSRAIHGDRDQLLLLPRSVDEFVPEDDQVRFVAEVVDALDLATLKLVDADPGTVGAPAYSVKMLLSIWLYGYMRRIRSTRQLEIACRERLPVLWLTGMKTPDHNTLWRFFNKNRVAIREVFAKVVMLARMNGMVSLLAHALDGTKLQAASSTEKALHRDELQKQLKEIRAGIEKIEKVILQTNAQEEGSTKLPEQLAERAARKATIEQQLATLDAAAADHVNQLEPDAKPMSIRGTRTKLGFNAQSVVDDQQMIVAQDVGNNASDVGELLPMLEQATQTLGERPEQTLVDGGYVSARTLKAADEKGHILVVPEKALVNAESRPENPFDKVHFRYDRDRDIFICPLGEILPLSRLTRDKVGAAEKAVYRCAKKDCPSRAACTKDPKGRTVRRSPDDEWVEKQRAKQNDPEVAALYSRRKTIVEPVFGQIKANDGFRRFTVRGLANARAQWSLVCTGHNLRKMFRVWLANGRCGLRAA